MRIGQGNVVALQNIMTVVANIRDQGPSLSIIEFVEELRPVGGGGRGQLLLAWPASDTSPKSPKAVCEDPADA